MACDMTFCSSFKCSRRCNALEYLGLCDKLDDLNLAAPRYWWYFPRVSCNEEAAGWPLSSVPGLTVSGYHSNVAYGWGTWKMEHHGIHFWEVKKPQIKLYICQQHIKIPINKNLSGPVPIESARLWSVQSLSPWPSWPSLTATNSPRGLLLGPGCLAHVCHCEPLCAYNYITYSTSLYTILYAVCFFRF